MRRGVVALAGAAIGFAIAAPTLGFGFPNWDDTRFIADNPMRARGLGECLGAAFGSVQFEAWHPLHMALLCGEMAAGGEGPLLYHATSSVLSALLGGALALWLVLEGLSAARALLACAVALAHPLMVESLASPASHKDLLGLLFGVSALLVCAWSAAAPASAQRVHAHAVAVGVLVLCAGLSKSGYAMFGGVVLLRHLTLGGLWPRAALRRAWLAIAVVPVVLGVAAWVAVGAKLPRAGARWGDLPLIGATVLHYARRLVWPVDMVPLACLAPSGDKAVLGVSLLALLVALAAACAARRVAWVAFGAGAALLGLVPYLNLVPTPLLVSDRYATLVVLGFTAALAGAGASRALLGVLAALVVVLVPLSLREQRRWRDAASLWSETAAKAPCWAVGHLNLSVAQFGAGDRAGAEASLYRAVAAEPDAERVYRYLVLFYLLDGDCGPPLDPGDAQALFARLPSTPEPEKLLGARPLPATRYVLRLRALRASGGDPSSDAELDRHLGMVGLCHAARARHLRELRASR